MDNHFDMEALKQALNAIQPIEENNWLEIEPLLIIKNLAANDYLLKAGEVCTFIAFINEGSFRTFYTKDDEHETNFLLNAAFDFTNNYESFTTGLPSNLSIQAIENSEVILLPKAGLMTLYETSFYWNKFGRMAAEHIFIRSKRRAEELLFMSPEERYLNLMKYNADFFQKFPLKYIASYMGITPQSLSRIRARLSGH